MPGAPTYRFFIGAAACQPSHSSAGHRPSASKAASTSATTRRIASLTRASSHSVSVSGSNASGRTARRHSLSSCSWPTSSISSRSPLPSRARPARSARSPTRSPRYLRDCATRRRRGRRRRAHRFDGRQSLRTPRGRRRPARRSSSARTSTRCRRRGDRAGRRRRGRRPQRRGHDPRRRRQGRGRGDARGGAASAVRTAGRTRGSSALHAEGGGRADRCHGVRRVALDARVGFVYDQAAPIGEVVLGRRSRTLGDVPRPCIACRHASRRRAARDRSRRAGDRRPPAGPGRRAVDRERRHDRRRHCREHRPGTVQLHRRGALAGRAKLAELVQEMLDSFSFAADVARMRGRDVRSRRSYRGYRFQRTDDVGASRRGAGADGARGRASS